MFEKVLFPLDRSREAMETVSKVLQLALDHKSNLIVLSVVQSGQDGMDDYQDVASFLKRVRDQVEKSGLACEILEREGKPAFEICDAADELNVDLIVMGTRGSNLEVDSDGTAIRVIQFAPCPVLVIP